MFRTTLAIALLTLGLLAGAAAAAPPPTPSCLVPGSPLAVSGVPGQSYALCLGSQTTSGCNSNTDIARLAGSQYPAGARVAYAESSYDCRYTYPWYSYRSAGNTTRVEAFVNGVAMVQYAEYDNQYSDSYGQNSQSEGKGLFFSTFFGPSGGVSQYQSQYSNPGSQSTSDGTDVNLYTFLGNNYYQQRHNNGGPCQAYFAQFGNGPCYADIPQLPNILPNL